MDTLQTEIQKLNRDINGEVNHNMFHVYADYVMRLIQLCDRLQSHNTINTNISVEPKIQWLNDKETTNAPNNNIVSDIEMQLVDLMVSMYEFIKTTLDETEHNLIDDFAMTKFPGFVSVMGNDNKILNLDTIQDLSELLFWIFYMSMPISICHKIIKIRSTLSDNIILRTDRKTSRERSIMQLSFVKPEIAEELIKIIGTDKYTQLLLQPYTSNYKYIELLVSYGKLSSYIDKGWINIEALIEHRFTFGMSLLHLLIFEEEINLCKNIHISYDYLYQSIPEETLPLSSLSTKIKDIVIPIFENVTDDNHVYPYELLDVYNVDKFVNVIPSWLLVKQSKKIITPQKYDELFIKMIAIGTIDREFVRQKLNDIIQLSLAQIFSDGDVLEAEANNIIGSLKKFLDKEIIESTFKLGDKEFPTATLIVHHELFNTVLGNSELYDAYIDQLKKYPTLLTPLLFGQNCNFEWETPQYGFATLLMLLKSANTIDVANAFCKSMWFIFTQYSLSDYINLNTEVNMTTSDTYVYDEFVKTIVTIHENQKASVDCLCFIMTNLEIGNKYIEDVFFNNIHDIHTCIIKLFHLLLRNIDSVVEYDIDYYDNYAKYMKIGAKANCLKLINKYSSIDLFSNFDTKDIIDIFQIYHEENHPLIHLIEQQMFDYRKIFGLRPEGAKLDLTVRYNLRIMDVIRNAYKVWEKEDVTNNALMNIEVIESFDELRDLPRIMYCLKTLYNVTSQSLYRHPSAFAKIIDTKDCPFIQLILSTFDITSCEISQELKQKLNEMVRNIIDIQTTTEDQLSTDLLKILFRSNVVSIHTLDDEYYIHIELLLEHIPILFRTFVDQGIITQETLLKENIVMNMLLYYEHIQLDSPQFALGIKSLRNTITTAHFEKMIEHNINCLISLFSKKIFTKDELLEKDHLDHTLIDRLFSAITLAFDKISYNKTKLINIVESIIDNYDCDVFKQYARNIIELGGIHKIIGRIDISEIIGKYNTIEEFVSMITSTGIEQLIKCLKALIEHPNEIHYNYINDILKVSIIPLFTSVLSPVSMIQCLINTDKKFYIELIVSMGNHADKLAIQHVQKCIEESDINNDLVINAFRHGLIELNDVLINKYPDFIFIDDIPMSDQNIMRIIDESTTNDIIFDKLTNSSYSQKMTQKSMNVLQLMLTKYLETDFNLFIDAVGKISCDYNTIGFGSSSEKNNKIREICNDNPLVMANLITGKFFKDIKDVLSIFDRHGNYTVSHITNETIIKSALEVLTIDDLKVNNKLGNPRLMAFLNNSIGYKIITGKDVPYDIKDLETIVNKYGMNIYHYMMENNDFDKIPKEAYMLLDHDGRNVVMNMCSSKVDDDLIIDGYRYLISKDKILSTTLNSGLNILHFIINKRPQILKKLLNEIPTELLASSTTNDETILMYAIKHNVESAEILLKSERITGYHSYINMNSGSILSYCVKYAPSLLEKILSWKYYTDTLLYVKNRVNNFIILNGDTEDGIQLNILQYASIMDANILNRLLKLNKRIVGVLLREKIKIHDEMFDVLKLAIYNIPDSVCAILSSELVDDNYIKETFNMIGDNPIKIVDIQPGSWYYLINNSKTEKYCIFNTGHQHWYGYNYKQLMTKELIGTVIHYAQHRQELYSNDDNKCNICQMYKRKVIFTKCKHVFCVVCSLRTHTCSLCQTPTSQNEKVVIL